MIRTEFLSSYFVSKNFHLKSCLILWLSKALAKRPVEEAEYTRFWDRKFFITIVRFLANFDTATIVLDQYIVTLDLLLLKKYYQLSRAKFKLTQNLPNMINI